MAIKKQVEPVAEEDVTPVKDVEEPKASEKEVPAPKAKPSKMVAVKNKARFDYVQPSTGIKVRTHQAEPTKVLDDQWVAQFVAAGLLERV